MAPTLLTLPGEIRNIIFGYALTSHSWILTLDASLLAVNRSYLDGRPPPLTIWECNNDEFGKAENVIFSLALLRTCKQIHQECKLDIWAHHQIRLGNRLMSELNVKAGNYGLPVILPFTLIQELELPFRTDDHYNILNHGIDICRQISLWAKEGELRSLTVKMFCKNPPTCTYTGAGPLETSVHQWHGNSVNGHICVIKTWNPRAS